MGFEAVDRAPRSRPREEAAELYLGGIDYLLRPPYPPSALEAESNSCPDHQVDVEEDAAPELFRQIQEAVDLIALYEPDQLRRAQDAIDHDRQDLQYRHPDAAATHLELPQVRQRSLNLHRLQVGSGQVQGDDAGPERTST